MADVYKCKWCPKEFISLRELTAHYSKCANKPTVTPAKKKPVVVECRCGKKFTSRSTYNQHAATCRKAR